MKNDTVDSLHEDSFIRQKLFATNMSALTRYRVLVIGNRSLLFLIWYELVTVLFGSIPGAVGLYLRKIFYRTLFKEIGKGVVFGRNVTIRCPSHIVLGNQVVIDDGCFLDGRGAEKGKLVIGDNVILNRNCTVQSKVGPLHIGANCLIGAGTTIVSQGGVCIGQWVGFAGGCKVSGGLFELKPSEDTSDPPWTRHTKGPVRIDGRCVFAYGAIVLDGVHIGQRCMIGPGTVVMQDLPDGSIASTRPGVILRK